MNKRVVGRKGRFARGLSVQEGRDMVHPRGFRWQREGDQVAAGDERVEGALERLYSPVPEKRGCEGRACWYSSLSSYRSTAPAPIASSRGGAYIKANSTVQTYHLTPYPIHPIQPDKSVTSAIPHSLNSLHSPTSSKPQTRTNPSPNPSQPSETPFTPDPADKPSFGSIPSLIAGETGLKG